MRIPEKYGFDQIMIIFLVLDFCDIGVFFSPILFDMAREHKL